MRYHGTLTIIIAPSLLTTAIRSIMYYKRHTWVFCRWQVHPLLSGSIVTANFQPYHFLRCGTRFGHYAIRSQASPDENSTTEAPTNSESETNTTSAKKAKERADVRKGQATAIITGAIAVLLGVGYLILVQILDTRGVVLQPPPPEAFEP